MEQAALLSLSQNCGSGREIALILLEFRENEPTDVGCCAGMNFMRSPQSERPVLRSTAEGGQLGLLRRSYLREGQVAEFI